MPSDQAMSGDIVERLRTLDELISAVEGASGPDRMIDVFLWREFDHAAALRCYNNAKAGKPALIVPDEMVGLGKHALLQFAPPLTASIDAALGLVERVLPGWEWTVSFVASDATAGVAPPVSVLWTRADAATPALALILATLRALKHKEAGR